MEVSAVCFALKWGWSGMCQALRHLIMYEFMRRYCYNLTYCRIFVKI